MELYEALIEHSIDGLLITQPDGSVLRANPAACRILGRTEEEIRAAGRAGIVLHDDDLARLLEERARTGVGRGELRFRRRDGALFPVEVTSAVIPTRSGRRYTYVIFRDVSEQRGLEERLREAQRLEGLGRLAGGVAHDFNNLLTVILSCADAIRADLAAGAPADPVDADEIHGAAERARELTRQLLAFARRQRISPVPLDLGELARGSERLLRRVLGADVGLRVSVAPGLWTVRCDPAQLEQVVMNLAVNARDAMPGGGTLAVEVSNVEVDARHALLHPGLVPGPFVRLAVQDTGVGMPPEVVAHAFEPFYTTKPEGLGTGLGLATVHGIVRQSGGFVRLESAPGQGTLVELLFPRIDEAPAAAPAPPQPAAARGSETILLVEDDPQVREVMVRTLRGAGYRVLPAADGAAALSQARAEPGSIDLVVADVVLPGQPGGTVADELRRERPGLPVLHVSGHAEGAMHERGALAPGAEFLAKPFTSGELLARVREVLGRRPAGGPPRSGA